MIQVRRAEGQNAGRRVEHQGGIMESRVVAPRVRPQGWTPEWTPGLHPRVVDSSVTPQGGRPQGQTPGLDPRVDSRFRSQGGGPQG